MFNNPYNPDINPGDTIARSKFKQTPMPDKAELQARHSFPGPDDNRYIDAFMKKVIQH